MVRAIPKMPVSHQGDGLKMAMELGAATRHIGIAVAGSWPLVHRNAFPLHLGARLRRHHGQQIREKVLQRGFG